MYQLTDAELDLVAAGSNQGNNGTGLVVVGANIGDISVTAVDILSHNAVLNNSLNGNPKWEYRDGSNRRCSRRPVRCNRRYSTPRPLAAVLLRSVPAFLPAQTGRTQKNCSSIIWTLEPHYLATTCGTPCWARVQLPGAR
jgi:hypothetical protein